ncbi:MAG: tRNA (adenosine(37)-N6)-threonylcarbamoyltransferase complex ATPase subunit type 1 TsaE [Propionibacteriaceae bacterium]|jgi:tRNA threonylcarbamoyladenosine biosynthesis protein TsaE|nr:tRNA (adenosine(37)-N6)-threonylcarbamoyltransferase complex ATPase subunit type 1 TsaE [Propionibacteriaceae bacterium]
MGRTVLAGGLLADGRALELAAARPEDGQAMLEVVLEAFGHRPQVDPPAEALAETAESLAAKLDDGFGVLALVDGQAAGLVLVRGDEFIQRVCVRPGLQHLGIATAMVEVAMDQLARRGAPRVELVARAEFPAVVELWRRNGFHEVGRDGTSVRLRRQVPVRVEAPTADDMRALGVRLASVAAAGDLIIMTGELGAGKTTLTQGLGEGLGVEGPVLSPTFVLSRVHPSPGGGPALVHVDAYRLGGADELEDLDAAQDDAVTVVEWGAGMAEGLSDQRLEIEIRRSAGDDGRVVYLSGIGRRWDGLRRELESVAETGSARTATNGRPGELGHANDPRSATAGEAGEELEG